MNIKMSFILYGGVVVTGALYIIFRKMRAHSATHKPEVMNKISDFFEGQDNKY